MNRTMLSTAPVLPNPAVAQYFFTAGTNGVTTSNVHGTGTLRVVPWRVMRTLTIDRLGGEVTSAGDAGSKVRLGIYADTGNCYPGALVLDAGQIAGDSATVQDITGLSTVLTPGLYWIGGAVQTVTTTQPTLRIVDVVKWTPPVAFGIGTSAPTAGATAIGYAQLTTVTGALPNPFTSTVTITGTVVRTHVRVA